MADLTDDVLVSLRRIIRATDLHSRRLGKQTGLTTPQLVVMRAIEGPGSSTVSAISREVSLSQATVTNILNRLQSHGLVRRKRSVQDRRRVDVSLTAAGRKVLSRAPEPLQEKFLARFGALEMWEQHQLGVGDQRESSGPSAVVSSSSQGS